MVYYCNTECQKADWSNHKNNCLYETPNNTDAQNKNISILRKLLKIFNYNIKNKDDSNLSRLSFIERVLLCHGQCDVLIEIIDPNSLTSNEDAPNEDAPNEDASNDHIKESEIIYANGIHNNNYFSILEYIVRKIWKHGYNHVRDIMKRNGVNITFIPRAEIQPNLMYMIFEIKHGNEEDHIRFERVYTINN
jgi:hypothetical protein